LAGAAALALPRTTAAQAALSATKLTDTITLITGAGNNVILLAGDNRMQGLLVDAGDAAHGADVLKLAGSVRRVVNTHYHLESTGGNDVMAQAGATIVAHLNTKLWMTQEIISDWEGGKVYPPRAKTALPAETIRGNSEDRRSGSPCGPCRGPGTPPSRSPSRRRRSSVGSGGSCS
jgi:glyoxylase-like metal-dependent hydrolase (beta-lactamase superfamily II)